MRINHTGEVCAQALYQGQALTARLDNVRDSMEQAAQEENDHLVWCQQRVHALGSHTSVLNPLFYAGSFALGAVAGVIGDKWSLGFVAETERQVVNHLDEHLTRIAPHDHKSRAILEQMKVDETASRHHRTGSRWRGAAQPGQTTDAGDVEGDDGDDVLDLSVPHGMSTLTVQTHPLAQHVEFTDDDLIASLVDGRNVIAPLIWFPRLSIATRSQWRITNS